MTLVRYVAVADLVGEMGAAGILVSWSGGGVSWSLGDCEKYGEDCLYVEESRCVARGLCQEREVGVAHDAEAGEMSFHGQLDDLLLAEGEVYGGVRRVYRRVWRSDRVWKRCVRGRRMVREGTSGGPQCW